MTEHLTALDLKKGELARITGIKPNDFTCRLLTLGILPEKNCSLVSISPFGGSGILSLESHLIALRDDELKSILIQKIKEPDHE